MPLSDEFRAVFTEVTASSAASKDLHPLRLDRWWRELVGAPEVIYMQLGVEQIFRQIDEAAKAIRQMIELLGEENLPLAPQEFARRHIRNFQWQVNSSNAEHGTHVFVASWAKETSSWRLLCRTAPETEKKVPSLEEAVSKATSWAVELDREKSQSAEE